MVYFVVTVYLSKGQNNNSYQKYKEKVKQIVSQYGGRYLLRSESITPLSKDWAPDRMIIIEFDTREQINQWLTSKEYEQIKSLREESVDARAIIVEEG